PPRADPDRPRAPDLTAPVAVGLLAPPSLRPFPSALRSVALGRHQGRRAGRRDRTGRRGGGLCADARDRVVVARQRRGPAGRLRLPDAGGPDLACPDLLQLEASRRRGAWRAARAPRPPVGGAPP